MTTNDQIWQKLTKNNSKKSKRQHYGEQLIATNSDQPFQNRLRKRTGPNIHLTENNDEKTKKQTKKD